MDKPTLSPQSNRLIEKCEAIMAGESTAEELAELLEEMFTGLEKAKNDFISEAESRGEGYLEQMQQEMEYVLTAFDQYQAGLEEISHFLQSNDVQFIKNGIETIINATADILNFLTVYESKSLQLGPTSFPILNMLILLTDAFKNEKVSEDEYRFMIYNATQFFIKILDELEGYQGDKAPNALEILKDGYGMFIDGLDKLDEGALGRNELIIDDALEMIRQSQEIIKTGYSRFNDEMFLSGPTESAFANLLISSIEGHKEGIFPKDILMDNLAKFEEEMHSLKVDIEGLMSIPTDNQDILDEFPRTQQAFDLIEEAIESIKAYFQNNNQQHLNTSVEKLKEGMKLLKESQENYETIGEKEGKIACIRCGHHNDPSGNLCGKCNAVLPKIHGEGMMQSTFQVGEAGVIDSGLGADFVMTENLKKLVDASAAVRDGKISFEEYETTLNWMDSLIESARKDLESDEKTINVEAFAPEDREAAQQQKEIIDDTIATLEDGLDDFNEGLRHLRMFGEDPDVDHLRKGLEKCVEGSMKLYQVEKVSELAQKELAQLNLDSSASSDSPQEPASHNSEADSFAAEGIIEA